ncbi:hypothetical protein [Streptomyces sp. NPDC091209]|uniref:hypothetical protein n=1 Tax=Streptomyces sp. NPDC091209 TaxID=3365974 RepID=UPI0038259BDE
MLFLQNKELDQQVLHQHGRTEHVRVRQIQWSAGDGMGDSAHLYTVTVLDGPPLAPIEENGLMGWKWVVGGTYTVTVDPQGRAPLRRGDKPGPPVIQQFLQIPLGLGLAFTLWRPAGLLLRRQRVPSAAPRPIWRDVSKLVSADYAEVLTEEGAVVRDFRFVLHPDVAGGGLCRCVVGPSGWFPLRSSRCVTNGSPYLAATSPKGIWVISTVNSLLVPSRYPTHRNAIAS